MQFPLSWLKEYLSLPESVEQIAEALTSLGIEVEHILTDPEIIIKVSLTPNLAHCNSVRGIARELSAYYRRPLLIPPYVSRSEKAGTLSITLENPHSSPHYSCCVIEGIAVKDSPAFLQQRLLACGISPINNVVDATNLIMLELGQPLHAFDFDTLGTSHISVRHGRAGDVLITLNGEEKHPTQETLLICAGDKPIALAGVMGSLETQITAKTQKVLLESAYFSPPVVRRSSKHMALSSDASYRFERGVDPEAVIEAREKATALILAHAGGHCNAPSSTLSALPPKKISLRLPRIERLLGIALSRNEVIEGLTRMHLEVHAHSDSLLNITVPHYRHDLNIEADLIEELARFHGYHHLQKNEKALFRTGALPDDPLFLFEQESTTLLLRQGLQELITCDLISKTEASLVAFQGRQPIHLLNPSSQEQSVLRLSLLPGHLGVVKHNVAHEASSFSGYEIGRVHFKVKETFCEYSVAALTLFGLCTPLQWQHPKGKAVDFFTLKGIVEESLQRMRIKDFSFNAGHHTAFHPGRQAVVIVEGQEVGVLGEVHPTLIKHYELPSPVYYAELHLEQLLALRQPLGLMKPLPLFPCSTRDWTLSVAETASMNLLWNTLKGHSFPLLESCTLLDLYRGEGVGSGRKNITLRFVYRDREKTLSQKAVEEEHAHVTHTIETILNGKS